MRLWLLKTVCKSRTRVHVAWLGCALVIAAVPAFVPSLRLV